MSTATAKAWKALLARAGFFWCALPLRQVRQVLSAPKVYPLPGAADVVSGLAEVDGEPVVVLSLERLVKAPEGPGAEFPVILLVALDPANPGETLGLAVDEIGDLVGIDEERVVGPSRGPIRGEMQLGEQVVRVLDLRDLGSAA